MEGTAERPMSREEAMEMVKGHVGNKNLIKHMIAAEVVMAALARHFGEDAHAWGLTGLLHDVDYDTTADDPHRHSELGADMLREAGLPEDIVYAVRCHNEIHGHPRNSLLDKALHAADPLTGLIVAAALVHPDKKLNAIDTDFVMNRFKMSGFAKGANREQIAGCSEMGLDTRGFVDIALKAMQAAHGELGL